MHLVVVQVYIDYICNLLLNENKNWQNIPLLPLYWVSKIHVHFVVSRQGSSSAMEALGHQKALHFLLTTGLVITTFISDRHATIAKWMRETCPQKCKELGKPVIKHFFDLWHIGKREI